MKRSSSVSGAVLSAVLLVSGAAMNATAAELQLPTTVELFTSQGCSSCPPADALLTRLAERDDVVALAFHVNYWDRLGWPDPFATEWGTQRQYGYARSVKGSGIYTPQMVVGGMVDVVGSRPAAVAHAIEESASTASERVAVTLEPAGSGRIRVRVAASARPPRAASINIFIYDLRRETAVHRGENGGRRLSESNVVRNTVMAGPYNGQLVSREIAVGDDCEGCGYAALVQLDGLGGVLGAAKLEFPAHHRF